MSIIQRLLAAGLLLILSGCQVARDLIPSPTPLPGWRVPVEQLLLEDEAFPEGWSRIRSHPANLTTDPTINHVYRSWWWEDKGAGSVEQAIWRSYTVANAEKQYAELYEGKFWVNRTPPPPSYFVPFAAPEEISFQSQIADEWYLACGYRLGARCIVLARYRNYVMVLDMEREAIHDERITHGISYSEIESITEAADAKFAEAIAEFYKSSQ